MMQLCSSKEALTATAARRRRTELTSRVINEDGGEDITVGCNTARMAVLQQGEGRPSLCVGAQPGHRHQAEIALHPVS